MVQKYLGITSLGFESVDARHYWQEMYTVIYTVYISDVTSIGTGNHCFFPSNKIFLGKA